MILYCIKSILCLGLLWGFYKLFLEKEQIHFVKRFYLLCSLLISLTIPLLTLTYEKEIVVKEEMIATNEALLQKFPALPDAEKMEPLPMLSIAPPEKVNWALILWNIYVLGVIVFGLRFGKNLRKMILQVRRHEKMREPSHVNVLVSKNIIPYTFLNYIFVPKKEFQEKGIPKEVLHHEKTHVLQKHTLDILFVEAMQVAFWFNPLFVPLKRAIRLNHEFLADQNVLKQQFSIHNYIELLVHYPNSPNQTVLASSINYSLTKKRLQMMTTHFSRKRVALKICALIPVLTGCILLFNNEIVAKEVVSTKPSVAGLGTAESNTGKVSDNVAKFQEAALIQDGVSKAELKEYRQWIRRIKKQGRSGNGVRLQKEEVDRMEMLYNAMSSDQKSKVQKLTDVIPPPPPSPGVRIGEVSNIPPPPPPAHPEIEEIPEAPEPPAVPEIDQIEIEIEEEALREEIEQIRMEQELIQQEVERGIEEAMLEAEEAQMEAMATLESGEVQRALAMEQAQMSREQAEKIRMRAMEQARAARAVALEAAQKAREAARTNALEARTIAMEQATKARELARQAAREAHKVKKKEFEIHRKAMEVAHEARNHAEKVRIEAMKEARKAQLNRTTYSSYPLMKEMANKDAEFYYNGKKISSKKALEIVRKSGDNLSINVKTKNGTSKVKIRE